jgi:F1F0 ATPase subunit 2
MRASEEAATALMHTLVVVGGWIVAGGLLGCGYFGGLWLTVRHLPQRRRPERALLASFLIRVLVLMLAIHGMTGGAPHAVLSLMAGFLAARAAWIRVVAVTKLGLKPTSGKADLRY